jgi:hypothetical protein
MTYRVYSGPKGSADVSPLEKSQSLFKELRTLDEVLSLGAALGAYWQDATADRRRRRDANEPPRNR